MLHSTHRHGLTFPQIVCDTCEMPVSNVAGAIVQLFLDGRVRVVHGRGAPCDDRRNGGAWMPLDVFLHCLLRGLGYDARQARVEAEQWARLG